MPVYVCVSPEYIKDAKGKQEERIRKGLVEKIDTMRRVVAMLLSGVNTRIRVWCLKRSPEHEVQAPSPLNYDT